MQGRPETTLVNYFISINCERAVDPRLDVLKRDQILPQNCYRHEMLTPRRGPNAQEGRGGWEFPQRAPSDLEGTDGVVQNARGVPSQEKAAWFADVAPREYTRTLF